MAAGYVAQPGSQFGPCVEECMHRDCDASRRAARAACMTCGKPIGYETGYFSNREYDRQGRPLGEHTDTLEHALCAYGRAEEGSA